MRALRPGRSRHRPPRRPVDLPGMRTRIRPRAACPRQHRRSDQMTEPSEIRAGDRVTLRGSDPPKAGRVIGVLDVGADLLSRLPAGYPQPGPPNMAWVSWKGETKPAVERLADLIELT